MRFYSLKRKLLGNFLLFSGAFLILLSMSLLFKSLLQKETPPLNFPSSPIISVINQNNEVEQIELEEFLVGVLAAEVPASFEQEALKAQAIAARTYIMNNMDGQDGASRHGNAVVCCDFNHCQAFCSIEEMKANWGDSFDEYYNKIRNAVAQTAGEVIVYEGKIINALYSSTCGGSTTAAKDYWSADIPYLQSVTCGFCEDSPRYLNTQTFSLQEAAELLSCSASASALQNKINSLSAKSVREALNLFSADFSYETKNQNITFTSSGSGHGVGLCQYGANGMAKEGYTSKDIILHYYTGVEIINVYDD